MNIPDIILSERLELGRFRSLYRGRGPEGWVLVEAYSIPPLTASQAGQIRFAYEAIQALETDGIVAVLDVRSLSDRVVVIKEDFDGLPLSALPREQGLPSQLNIAIQLAQTLDKVHRGKVIHRDLRPQNILLNPLTGQIKIANFKVPLPVPLVRGGHWRESLPYLSPEQSGRMNRTVDYRTDLYSLGIVLYQLFTGQVPFQAQDILEIFHGHIAQAPRPPSTLNRDIPQALSAVVMKLLAKSAEDRYQSGAGLQADLEECRELLLGGGTGQAFVPGLKDVSSLVRVSQKIYGRQGPLETLLSAYDRAVAGQSEVVFIAGPPGIGKTALVQEAQRALVRRKGFFVSSSFQQGANEPYGGTKAAIRELVRWILTEDEERVARWREELQAALGANGRILLDMVPEMALIVGDQPPVPSLEPREAEQRFHLLFRRLADALATREHPLVVFLDNLQWLDQASSRLLSLFLAGVDLKYFLLVGALRDGEPSPALAQVLEALGPRSQTLTLAPLSREDIDHLIVDSLGRPAHEGLCELVLRRTGGNPFFLRQLLMSLCQENLLLPDKDWGWRLNGQGLAAMPASDDVADLLSFKIRRLSPQAQDLLQTAACLGSPFEVEVLHGYYDHEPQGVFPALEELTLQGLIVEGEEGYAFVHDRVREVAESLVGERATRHLRLGRLLLEQAGPERLADVIFRVVKHLNHSVPILSDEKERVDLARLNLAAGERAMDTAAYHSAVEYLATAYDLLPPTRWQSHHDLAFTAALKRGEGEYIIGRMEGAEGIFDEVLANAASPSERAAAACKRISLYSHQARPLEAVKIGLDCLATVGLRLSPSPGKLTLAKEMLLIKGKLWGRSMEEFLHLPDLEEPNKLIILKVLKSLLSATYLVDQDLFALVVLKMVRISLTHGNSPFAPLAYMSFAIILGSGLGDHPLAEEFGKLAIRLFEDRYPDARERTPLYFLLGAYVNDWTSSFKVSFEILSRCFQSGQEHGDMLWAIYAGAVQVFNGLLGGRELEGLGEDCCRFYAVACQSPFRGPTLAIVVSQNLILDLTGTPEARSCDGSQDGDFDEARHREALQQADFPIVLQWYALTQMEKLYLFEDLPGALKAAQASEDLLSHAFGFTHLAEHCFLHGLILLGTVPSGRREELRRHKKALKRDMRRMERWARACPANFQARAQLLQAEMARASGQAKEAMSLYDQAIHSARRYDLVQLEALGSELAGRFYLEREMENVAGAYLRDGRSAYRRWGAQAKVRQLEDKYSGLLDRVPSDLGRSEIQEASYDKIDLLSVLGFSQALSEEVQLDRLMTKLLQIVIKNAGAQRGVLLLEQEGRLAVEASGTADGEVAVLQSLPVLSSPDLPRSVLNFVSRTQEDVVLNDASGAGLFKADPYFLEHPPRSVLCVPIVKQSQLIAILYLENNLISDAFTPDRLQVIKLLSSQTAISLENAILYRQMEQLNASLKREIQERERAESALLKARKLESLGLMAGGIVHDFNNFLQSILGSLEFARELVEEGTELHDFLCDAEEASQLARDLTLQLLPFSKGGDPVKKAVHLGRLMEREGVFCTRGTAVSCELVVDDDLWPVEVDEGQIGQAINNMVVNACQAMGKGGTLRLGAQNVRLARGDALAEGEYVLLSIEDEGGGILEEIIERVFDPCFTTKEGGSGLGLATACSIVKKHGGVINLESRPGRGATFLVYLPALVKKPSPQASGPQAIDQARILLMDDDAMVRRSVGGLLARLGCQVEMAGDGQEALELYRKAMDQGQPFHAVILDLTVQGGMGGQEAIRSLRRLDPLVKAIVCSGYSNDQVMANFRAYGFQAVLAKPFRLDEVREILRQVLCP